jgi:hypothetical protein
LVIPVLAHSPAVKMVECCWKKAADFFSGEVQTFAMITDAHPSHILAVPS